ncbi:MAG: hypothetical protein NXI31_12155 [bacterium]|nr:hypothetical protein [bacterium]
MNDTESIRLRTVRSRELDTALEAACGRGAPPGLVAAVRQACESVPPPRRAAPRVLVAAAIVLGLAVVFTIASLTGDRETRQSASSPTSRQDPKPAAITITTAAVRARAPVIADPGRLAAEQRLLAIASSSKARLVIDTRFGGFGRESRVDLAGCGWAEAIDRIAHEFGGSVRQFGDVVLVDGDADARPPTPERGRITLSAQDLTIGALGEKLHAEAGVNLVITSAENTRFDVEVADVPWRALLATAAAAIGLESIGCGGTIAVRPRAGSKPLPAITNNYSPRPATELLDSWAKTSGQSVAVSPGLAGEVVSTLFEPTRDGLFATIAAVTRADIQHEDRNVRRLVPTKAPDETIAVNSAAMVPPDFLTFVGRLGLIVDAPQIEDEPVAIFASRARIFDLVRAIAIVNGQELRRSDAGYAIE